MLDDKIALITGAGQGIGRAIAIEMARQGAASVVVTDRDERGAAETAALVRDAGATSEALMCDLRDARAIDAMVAAAAELYGGIDVVVNNAGIIETHLADDPSIDMLPEAVWNAVYEVNLRAVWLVTKNAAPHLRRSQRGPNIVNAASVAGLTGFARAPAYCATKGAVIQLTKAAAVDLAPIRCNCFCPGMIDTQMTRVRIDASDDPDRLIHAMTAPQLVPRPGRSEEVAKVACFLASDDAAFITGTAHVIDGGTMAWRGQRKRPR